MTDRRMGLAIAPIFISLMLLPAYSFGGEPNDGGVVTLARFPEERDGVAAVALDLRDVGSLEEVAEEANELRPLVLTEGEVTVAAQRN